MKVGTLVKVREYYVNCFEDDQEEGTDKEMFGYVIETFPREEAVKWILRRKFDNVFREITGNEFVIMEDDGTPYGVICEIEDFLNNDVPLLTDIHKVMLENGRYGWVSEFELWEVEDEDEEVEDE